MAEKRDIYAELMEGMSFLAAERFGEQFNKAFDDVFDRGTSFMRVTETGDGVDFKHIPVGEVVTHEISEPTFTPFTEENAAALVRLLNGEVK